MTPFERLLVAAARWTPEDRATPAVTTAPGDRGRSRHGLPAGVIARITADLERGDAAEQLSYFAEWHRVGPALGLLLQELRSADRPAAPAPAHRALDALIIELAAHRRGALSAHLRAMHSAGLISQCLDGLPWVLIKGPVLAQVAYPRPDLRWYGDLDVVVAPEAFPEAVARLEAARFTLLDRDFDLARRLGLGQLHLSSPMGITVDLHHDLTHRKLRRARTALTVEAVLDGRLPIPGMPGAWRAAPAPALVHLCAHAAASGGDRLGWFADAHHSIRSEPPDWREFVQAARRARSVPSCLIVLATCRRVLGTPVPAWVLQELSAGVAGSVVRAACAVVETVDPLARRRGARPSLGRALARSAAGSHAATLAELRRSTTVSASRRLRAAEPSRESVLSGPPADPQQRRAYLADVEAGRFRALEGAGASRQT